MLKATLDLLEDFYNKVIKLFKLFGQLEKQLVQSGVRDLQWLTG